jgi:hypothetical protein
MSSWTIIRDSLVKDTKPTTFGRQIALVAASDLLVKLMKNLTDQEESVNDWKNEPELPESLANRAQHKALHDAGVIRGGG